MRQGGALTPTSGANSQANQCAFKSLGEGLSGAENRFDMNKLEAIIHGEKKLSKKYAEFLSIFQLGVLSRLTALFRVLLAL